jgi:hypothetical protein
MKAIRWVIRAIAAASLLTGIWLLLQPRPAATGGAWNEIRLWLLVIMPTIYFTAEYRLKLRAEQRADRAEAREIEAHRRLTDDTH